MRQAQRFPVDVRTSWQDYSPAFHYQAAQRIRSGLAEFASQIRAVTVRISDGEPHTTAQRQCEIEVMMTHAGQVSASSVGVNLFTLLDGAVDSVVDVLRQRARAESESELRQRIA
jgi:phage baseplate assembly protein gpV